MSDNPPVVWMGTAPPLSPSQAENRLMGLTGVGDILAGARAMRAGNLLSGFGQGAWGGLQLAGLVAPELRGADIAGALEDTTGAIQAWHGTPHTFPAEPRAPFGAFKSEAIGSGEGAQAYGWGHYVAGNPKVAQSYQQKLTEGSSDSGHLLEIHILPEEDELLDLDRPLDQQSPQVQEALKKLPWDAIDNAMEERDMNPMSEVMDSYTGRHLYQALKHYDVHEALPAEVPGSSWYDGNTNEEKHTSLYLDSIGIPGLKYLDQMSRAEGAGTHNYVIFDPSNLRIIGRNGQRLEPVDHDPFAGGQ